MYPVSEAFLQAVQENTRRYYWTGKITTTKGVVYEFGSGDIVKGSGYISSQCCGSNEIELGTVYSSEMGITLLTDIDRYTLEDALVELFYHQRLPDGSYEEVPMGIFEVSEANRKIKCLELKAYDFMLRFEKDFNGFETVGNAYDFMELCSKACRVELAQSREVIEALQNGKEILSVYTENDIETYRDMLYYVGQVLGGFFCMNRFGKLELRKYGTEPVMEFLGRHRFSSSFSDFITRYTAVSSTNRRTETAEYYALDPDDGLTMNLGVNPLLQFGLRETREQLCRNILADLAVINYVPFDSDTIGNPALDLGDVIRFKDGQADGSRISVITSMQCKIGGKHSLKGVGKNPRLAHAKSKNDKNISGLLNQITENKEAGKLGIHTFTNASAFTVAGNPVRIISIDFAANEEVMAQFFGSVVVDVKADPVEREAVASGIIVIPGQNADLKNDAGNNTAGSVEDGESGKSREGQSIQVELPVHWTEDGHAEVRFAFELNDEEILLHHPQESWCSGMHSILLYYPLENVMPDITNRFNVYMKVSGGTGKVDVGDCVASVSGQSMAAEEAWDGKVETEDFTGRFAIGGCMGFRGFSEEIGFETMECVKRGYADSIRKVLIGAFAKLVETEREE